MDTFKIYSILPISLQNLLCSIKGYKLNNQRYRGGVPH